MGRRLPGRDREGIGSRFRRPRSVFLESRLGRSQFGIRDRKQNTKHVVEIADRRKTVSV